MTKLRILLVSDAPWATSGYSVQAAMIAPMLRDLGHEVALLASFGLHGARQTWEGFPVYPGGLDGYGNDAIGPAARDWRADWVLTLKDLWVYKPESWGPGVRWAPLTPVDHDPLPPGIAEILRRAPGAVPIAYARYGEKALHDAGFAPLYAPHTVDLRVFAPRPRAEARAAVGLPQDRFIVGMVAVNRGGLPSRKAWPENLRGFAQFAHARPDAVLYCHTHDGRDGAEGSVNIPAIAEGLGIRDRIIITHPDQYRAGIPQEQVATLYSAFDVLNAVSVGEGFGVPTLEAQACGTPVVIGDWCASSELLFAGVAVRDAHRFLDAQGADIFLPAPESIAHALDVMYQRTKTEGEAMRALARAGASAYGTNTVREAHWRPVTEELARRLHVRSWGVLRVVRPEGVVTR